MYIERLYLDNFRNYKIEKLEFSKGFNIIYGYNAQGKTNIIEAIFLCASGRSHRTSKDIDMVNIKNNKYYIKIDINNQYSDKSIEMLYEKGKKKVISINEIPIKKIGNLMGNLLAVIFSPEDLYIIKEGPSQRRRFLDITISQIKPSYFYDLQQYNKILIQRNALLKEIQKNKGLLETLDIWDRNLAQIAARIMETRFKFIIRLNNITKQNHYKLTNGTENLNINYSPSVKIEENEINTELVNKIVKIMEKNRNIDLKRLTTSIGPHRDDYEMVLNGISLKLYGSQGQQRTAVLSIKLSEIDIIKDETGDYPILLLDDVMSELDVKRRQYLLDSLENIQTFITCTEKDFFVNESSNMIFISVDNGKAEINN